MKSLKLLFVLVFMILLITSNAQADYEWLFDNDTQGWTALHGSISSGDGNLYLSTNEDDPGVKSPGFSVKASENGLLLIHMSSNCPDTNGMIYFITSTSPSYDDAKKVPFTVSYGSGWYTYIIDMTQNSLWKDNVTGIRIDPAESGSLNSDINVVGFSFIRLEQKKGSITGGVRNDVGDIPIYNALVRLEQNSQIIYIDNSDSAGVYKMENVAPGTYDLVSIKAGFDNWIEEVTIGSSELSQNIAMITNVGSLTGGVRINGTTTPIYNALVRLEQDGDIKYTDYSDVNGMYEFSDIPKGDYKLVALKFGYEDWTSDSNGGDITIIAGQEVGQNITMEPIPETISTPGAPTGEDEPSVGTNYRYETTGTTSSLGHSLEYRFVWTSTNATSWSSNKYVYKTWNDGDEDKSFYVRVEARCADHQDEVTISSSLEVVPRKLNAPPTVNITSPENGDHFVNPYVTISGTADDVDTDVDDLVSRVDVRLNGGSWQVANGTIDWSFDVKLQDGENLIEVKSFDTSNAESITDAITITSNPSTDGVDLRFDSLSYDFGEIETNLTVEKVFTLYNDGATSSNGSFLVTGADADQFFVDDTIFVSARGEVQGEVTVKFEPTSSGEKVARLVARSMNSDDFEIEIRGTGTVSLDMEVFPTKLRMYQSQEVDINTEVCSSSNFDVDWSIYDSSVKNQGISENCWIFASLALVENFGNRKNLPVKQDLSEVVGDACLFGGDTGGYASNALDYIQNDGISEEFEVENIDCSTVIENSMFQEKILGIHRYWGTGDKIAYLKKALEFGPIVVNINIPNDGSFISAYKDAGGIYNSTYNDLNNTLEHAVLLVGYSDTDQCFKAKNSWGASWGENRCGELTGERGYFRISYDLIYGVVQFGDGAITINDVYLENEGDSFSIKNTGNESITVSSITSNQSWLSVDKSSTNAILPGEDVEVLITVNDWSAVSEDGSAVTITVISNSIDNPVVTIEVKVYSSSVEGGEVQISAPQGFSLGG